MTLISRSRSQAISSENLVTTITQEGSQLASQIYTKRVSIKDLGRVRILVTLTSRSQAISSGNLVSTITQEGSHVGFSNLYQACIYKRSQTSSDSGDLDLKVKVTGHFFWKSCFHDNSRRKSRRLLKFIPSVYL